jgi:oxysterol-binding protein 1
MVNACQELVRLIQNQGRKWQKTIQFERDARVRMERMCEQVASQSAKLEKQIQRASRKSQANTMVTHATTGLALKSIDGRTHSDESQLSDDDEFHDAISDPQTISIFRIP